MSKLKATTQPSLPLGTHVTSTAAAGTVATKATTATTTGDKDPLHVAMPVRPQQSIGHLLNPNAGKSAQEDTICHLSIEPRHSEDPNARVILPAFRALSLLEPDRCRLHHSRGRLQRCNLIGWLGKNQPPDGVALNLDGLVVVIDGGKAKIPICDRIAWPPDWRMETDVTPIVLNGGTARLEQRVFVQLRDGLVPIEPMLTACWAPSKLVELGNGNNLILRHDHEGPNDDYLMVSVRASSVMLSWYTHSEDEYPLEVSLDFERLRQLQKSLWDTEPRHVILLKSRHAYPLARFSLGTTRGQTRVTLGLNNKVATARS